MVKRSVPTVNLDIWSGYRSDNPSGLLQGGDHAYPMGGINTTLNGTLNKASYTRLRYSSGMGYSNVDQECRVMRINSYYTSPQFFLNTGFSFSFAFDERRALEVHMGDTVPVNLSPLLYSSLSVANRDGFFIDVSQAFRAEQNDQGTGSELSPTRRPTSGALWVKKPGAAWYIGRFHRFSIRLRPRWLLFRGL